MYTYNPLPALVVVAALLGCFHPTGEID